ncbi:uncharacterized protein FOMMEDRAFT_171606 [Fomitiporia mediterranea MF3/22]|uniref:Uncharacterized protein n=1 Tax=Fomitiporia mediterranea (strain MF3/22) TaxID=694068 RepID=R7SJ98_FOMME|nr:uncharacterized protein FOMMEDRAFT_171606 [Fomitiporia mediterranea MF3/22]EJC97684.1 hypothetical protein FOMMEDRAFT_171606 [Fomitiporia mediterranea MF3/22]
MVLPGHPDTVKAGAVASLTLPREWTKLMGRLCNQHVFSWAWCQKLTKLPASIVTLGFEAKVDDPKVGSREAQLTMFSGQLHRRALSFTDGPVFGATLNDNKLQFYVSIWENDTVVVRPVNDIFELKDFDSFIECYFFLCGLSEFQSLWLKKEMKRWNEDRDKQETKLRDSAAKPWRKSDRENNKGGRTNNSNQDRGDETDLGEVEPDEEDQDDVEVDVGTSRKHEIELLEDRINRGDSPPKDGYPLTEVYRYIFDHNPNFQSRRHVPSVSEWARESSQFVGHYEDADSDLIEYTMGEDVAASVDAVSSADTSDEMECDESHPNENVAAVDSNEELGNGLADSMVSPLGHPDEFSAKTGQPRIGLEKSTYNTFTMSGNS